VGSDKDYGKFHLPSKKSGHPSKGKMPVRDWLDLDEKGYEAVKEVVTNKIEEVLNNS
jgi:phage gpG-like protein